MLSRFGHSSTSTFVAQRILATPRSDAAAVPMMMMMGRGICSPNNATTAAVANFQFTRHLSTKDVFFKAIPEDLAAQVPPPPPIPGLPIPLEEVLASGQSVLEELDLWQCWKPSAWLRWGLELTHFYTGLPWWATISVFTAALRLTTLTLPIKMQKMTAKQQQHMPEIKEQRRRIEEARLEGDMMKVQQIMYEQGEKFKEMGFSQFKMLPIMACNGIIFMSQFFALRQMAYAKFPGFSTEGALWFTDLTRGDPYWLLPLLSAATVHVTLRSGAEMGSMDMYGATMKNLFLYVLPIMIFAFTINFPSAMCVYWVVNNLLTLVITRLLRTSLVKRLFKLPDMPKKIDASMKKDFEDLLRQWKSNKNYGLTGWSMSEIHKRRSDSSRQLDTERFMEAGQGRPVVPNVDELEKLDKKIKAAGG